MIDFSGSFAWCIVQASITTLVGIVMSMLVARRNSAAACSVACLTVVVAAAITIVAPLPVHQWIASYAESPARIDQQVDGVTTTTLASQQAANQLATADRPTFQIDLAQFAKRVQTTIATVELPVATTSRLAQALGWTLLGMIAIGVMRLASGVVFVVKLQRTSFPINDDRIELAMCELAESLACKVVPRVRRSDRLTSAAVAGWLRPVVLLPKEWTDWSDDELRAVLAHELAHCLRRDSLWRALASALVSAHFYNPLVHWLQRRVVLYQELSADQLAAETIGNHRYLQSLSKLAIQRDDQVERNGSLDLLPVFSGHLMRRITMLHSTDGNAKRTNQRHGRRTSIVAALVIAGIGIVTIAARGLAEPPTNTTKDTTQPVERVARARTVEPASSTDADRAMFVRQPLSTSIIAPNNTGMVVIRVRELLELPEVQPYAVLMQKMLPKWIESEVLGTEVGPIDLGAIEWVAGQAVMTTRNVGVGSDEKPKGAVMFGGRGFTIKLNRDFDLTSWINQSGIDAKHHVIEGRNVYEIAIPALGPFPSWLSMSDSKTVLATHAQVEVTEETKLADIFPTPGSSEHPMNARWADTWKRTDGGLFSVLYTNAEFYDSPPPSDGTTELEKAVEKLSRNIHIRCHNYAFGVDVTPDTTSLGIRIRLSHAGRGPASKSAREIRELMTLASESFGKDDALSDLDRDWIEMYESGMKNAEITTEKLADGTADVVIAANMPFEEVVQLYASAISEEFAAGAGD